MKSTIKDSTSYCFPGSTQASLLQRVKEGKEEAWYEFYEKYAAMIRRIGQSKRLSEEECEDLMIDVMVIFWQKVENFLYDPGQGRFRNYLGKIACYATFKRLRKNNRECVEELPLDYPKEVDNDIMEEWKTFLLQEALEELKGNIDTEVYQIFEMSYIQKRPIQEICTITRRTANNIYVIRSRCLKKLRSIVAAYREMEEAELRGRSSRKQLEQREL